MASSAVLVSGFVIAVMSLGGLFFAAVSSWLYLALDMARFVDAVGSLLWALAAGIVLFCAGLAGVLFALKWRGRSRGLGWPAAVAAEDGVTLLFGETAEAEGCTLSGPPCSQDAVTDERAERGN